ncbi:MAG: Peptidyl-tRNA hydrolase [Candidatus Magnetoglobus multicellularis str. Araruama]|uniref:Peptidyl-tRNA hydrolase n=1 Tax=Candidatus Magnetoglobus multicellularis str. Araruama TaxID=890399 RepID=A0A1V1PG36_9BACT|nr:MAG: Peptidyl-tRNA hydrolase [Candidatus Magnetoglobus multicellularis str. Araruama]
MSLDNNRIWMIAGLGNPGDEYEDSRHNIGFKVIDFLVDDLNVQSSKTKMNARIYETHWNEIKLFLIKPLGYMNRSGSVLYEIARYFHIDLPHIMTVHDDVDIHMGQIKIKQKGGHGGHNGIRSVIDSFGYDTFPRVRIGIGRPSTQKSMVNHVLGKFQSDEKKQVDIIIKAASLSIKTILLKGISQAMNQFNNKQILE